MDMSLEDIIKSKPSMVRRGKGGKSRGGGGGGGGGGRSRGGRRGGGFRSNPYSRDTPSGRWEHDKFEGGSRFSNRRSFNDSDGLTKLLISNLEYSVNDQDIKELFSEFGPLKSSSVHYDRSGRSLGTADVTYIRKTDATRALKTYNDVPLDGKPMRIELVADDAPMGNRVGGGRSFFGGRGRGRGSSRNSRGRGRGGQKKTTPLTAEELDAQLDEYKKKA